jgi:hypothetical protein
MTAKKTKRRQDRRRHHQRAQSDVRKEHDRRVNEDIENVRELLVSWQVVPPRNGD